MAHFDLRRICKEQLAIVKIRADKTTWLPQSTCHQLWAGVHRDGWPGGLGSPDFCHVCFSHIRIQRARLSVSKQLQLLTLCSQCAGVKCFGNVHCPDSV